MAEAAQQMRRPRSRDEGPETHLEPPWCGRAEHVEGRRGPQGRPVAPGTERWGLYRPFLREAIPFYARSPRTERRRGIKGVYGRHDRKSFPYTTKPFINGP